MISNDIHSDAESIIPIDDHHNNTIRTITYSKSQDKAQNSSNVVRDATDTQRSRLTLNAQCSYFLLRQHYPRIGQINDRYR
jgi:hypothetical protein